MDANSAVSAYSKALKAGLREHKHCMASGVPSYVQVLDEVFPDSNSAQQQSVGLMEIPIDLIVGTKTAGRQYALSPSFLPLLDSDTEFGCKWINLCNAHLREEGIREPIRCFEYYGKFYVQEGNKRVSVLRYFEAPTVSAYVTRLMPTDTDSPRYALYQEFLEFFRIARLYQVQFTTSGSYRKLLVKLEGAQEPWTAAYRQSFLSSFLRFEEALRGQVFLRGLSTADALLVFLRYHPFSAIREMDTDTLKNAVGLLQSDINTLAHPNPVAVSAEPAASEVRDPSRYALFGTRPKHLKIAFVHERDAERSTWTKAHETGRAYLDAVFTKQVETRAYFDAVPGKAGEEIMEQAIRDGANVIFTTTPPLVGATLRVAARHPGVRMLNCSVDMPYPDIRTYYGRVYEGKFITGAIAGAMARDGKIGYVGSYPIYGVPASINAFALGAKMVNPNVQIELAWSCLPGDFLGDFRRRGVKIVSNRDIPTPERKYTEYGIFLMDDSGSFWPLASPVWNWGRLYERIVRSILDDSWYREADGARAVNYWWGMSSGVIDVMLDDCLPEGVKVLAQALRRELQSGQLSPFDRSFSTQDGRLINADGGKLSIDEILHMDYLCSCVSGHIPSFDEILPMARSMVRLQGVYRDQIPPEQEAPL
ncbi:MAG: BMP family ABC transporter substrate-binding protein [Oscillospiraceae bacterium]|nr:BMP family ABC transporter substrate-binding protein [Oscillospiraceae bacterium]